jgi:hypothetical protein
VGCVVVDAGETADAGRFDTWRLYISMTSGEAAEWVRRSLLQDQWIATRACNLVVRLLRPEPGWCLEGAPTVVSTADWPLSQPRDPDEELCLVCLACLAPLSMQRRCSDGG